MKAAMPWCRSGALVALAAGLCTGRATGRALASSRGSRSLDLDDPKKYPVTKVVTLLKDMQAQLEKEADSDQEVYDKMICWCETNDKEKAMSVQEAQARIGELTTTIETSAADSGRLGQEIENHKADLAQSQDSLNTASALREKQAAEFSAEEKDMIQSIKALEAAIIVLSKHQPRGSSLLDRGLVAETLRTLQDQLKRHQRILRDVIPPSQRRVVLSLGQHSAFRQPFTPQSSEIFGILKQMKETFTTNLAESQKEETSNKQAYDELKAAKVAELQATQAAIDEKTARLAATNQKHADAKEEIEDTQNALSFTDKFLLDLKERCAATRSEYDSRVAMRQQEMTAVAEAVKVLSNDQARDTFSRVVNSAASFLQRSRSRRQRKNERRDKVVNLLTQANAKVRSPKLAAVVAAARLEPMAKVKEAIDALVAELLQEKKLEIEKRDSCISREHENERITAMYERDQSDLGFKIDGLTSAIQEITENVETIQKEISDLHVQIKRAGEDRELENKDFQAMVGDQREMQSLLAKAIQVLRQVYATKEVPAGAAGAAALLQATQPAEAPPAGFETYGKNRASGGVIGMIEQIAADAKSMETEALREEQQAQKDYETFVKDTNLSIQSKEQQVVNQSSEKSNKEQQQILAKEDHKSKTAELETLANTAAAIKMDCDFLVRNFDIRQEGRDQEVEALREAKAVLSGMRFDTDAA